jgi:class 3 adenylate cyclase
VTVLFCDLVGSTTLSSKLDPEIYRAVLARYHEHCVTAVQRFDGFVAQIQGDGVLAYFGYPIAHEAEADRAIRAALAILDAIATPGREERLAVRIGVASGRVVVSHVLASDRSAVGETPNLAFRLQAIASPAPAHWPAEPSTSRIAVDVRCEASSVRSASGGSAASATRRTASRPRRPAGSATW